MIVLKIFLFIALCLLSSCSDNASPSHNHEMQVIASRDEGSSLERYALYRIRVPPEWKRVDATAGESLQDTTKSLCEFLIEEGNERIKITIHNFPSHAIDDRIPPMAQISRWKRQFDSIDPTYQMTAPQSFSGYTGFVYEGKGRISDEDIMVMGWTMQLGPDHYRVLSRPLFPLQMRADITIKVIGPSNLVVRHRDEIFTFARSFELIEEIPAG